MFFSIVIPVYNVEKYLNQCVDSILSQTFKDFELILVNDDSKDNSGRICDELAKKDSRIKVVHKENGGAADSRNVGMTHATGEYLIFIDSDDYIGSESFLQDVYERAKNGVDIVCYKFKKFFDATQQYKECSFSIPKLEAYDSIADKVKALVSHDAFYCSPWSKTLKKSLIDENNIVFEKGLLGEDQEWYYHVMMCAKSIEGIDEAYIVYRQRPNSTSHSWKIKNLTDCLGIIEKWNDEIANASIDEDYKVALYNSLAKLYCNLLIAYTNFKCKEKKQYYKRLKNLSHLLKYNLNPRTKTFSKISKLVGFGLMMKALKLLCKLRGK